MEPTPPGPFITRFCPGPPLLVPTLGWLPGPPHSLVPLTGATLYVIDDAHAGEVYSQGDKDVRLISTAQALVWMVSATVPPSPPPPTDPPAAPPPEWLSKNDAAAALGVSPWTLEDVRKQAPADLPDAPHPGGAGKKRVQWRYPAEREVLLGWWRAATRSVQVDRKPTPQRAPKPRKRQRAKVAPSRARSMLAMLEEERG
jgi:hypothetical protein